MYNYIFALCIAGIYIILQAMDLIRSGPSHDLSRDEQPGHAPFRIRTLSLQIEALFFIASHVSSAPAA